MLAVSTDYMLKVDEKKLWQRDTFDDCKCLSTPYSFFFFCHLPTFLVQVGSFNYDNTKMVYRTYYLPLMPNSTESILDYRSPHSSLQDRTVTWNTHLSTPTCPPGWTSTT